VIIGFLSPELLVWVSPALLGLFLSVPLSRLSGSRSIAQALATVGLLRTPEERNPPALVTRRLALLGATGELPEDGLRYLAREREARIAHIQGNLPRPADPRGRPDPHAFTAEQKLVDARTLDEALAWLTPVERVEVAASARMLAQLSALPDQPRATFPM
jgi:membrane glycosyltransferase